MKTIGVTDLRKRAAELIDHARSATEPIRVLQGSRTVAYLVRADKYEADQAELRRSRHALFVAEVRDAEAASAAGSFTEYEHVEELIRDLKA